MSQTSRPANEPTFPKRNRFRPATSGEKETTIASSKVEIDKAVLKKLLPAEQLKALARKTGALDVRERKLTCVAFLWLVILALGSGGPVTLLGMVSLAVAACVMAGLPATKAVTSKQAISENFKRRPWQFFEAVLNYLLSSHALLFVQEAGLACLKVVDRVRLVDSTVMRVSMKLIQTFPGARTGRRKVWAALKLHVVLDLFQGVPDVLAITAQKANDRTVEFLRPMGERVLYIFDLGYWKYHLFDQIIELKQHFISRLRADCNPLIKAVYVGSQEWVGKRLKEITLTGKKCDLLVNLSSPHPSGAKMTHDVRLVGQWVAENQRWHLYITSLLDWKVFVVELIVQLYRLRWQIEIFFRDLKSVLKIANFVSTSENGIRIQIYAALIHYVLTHIVILKAAHETKDPPESFSIPACLMVVRKVLEHHVELLIPGSSVDWGALETRLVEAVKALRRRPNPKRVHRLTYVRNTWLSAGEPVARPP
jgi:putative transposase